MNGFGIGEVSLYIIEIYIKNWLDLVGPVKHSCHSSVHSLSTEEITAGEVNPAKAFRACPHIPDVEAKLLSTCDLPEDDGPQSTAAGNRLRSIPRMRPLRHSFPTGHQQRNFVTAIARRPIFPVMTDSLLHLHLVSDLDG